MPKITYFKVSDRPVQYDVSADGTYIGKIMKDRDFGSWHVMISPFRMDIDSALDYYPPTSTRKGAATMLLTQAVLVGAVSA